MKSALACPRGLVPIVVGMVGCALALVPAGAAGAAESFRVVNVPPGDVLNVRAGPSVRFPVLGTLARRQSGVEALGECVSGWCPVRDGILLGWASARFLEREPSASEQTGGAEPLVSLGTVLGDGTLERTYPDGRRIRRLPNGRRQTVMPDGTVLPQVRVGAPGAGLPTLPSELEGWATGVGDGLLEILKNILTPAEMEAYLETEQGKDLIELLNWRVESIDFLTTPAS